MAKISKNYVEAAMKALRHYKCAELASLKMLAKIGVEENHLLENTTRQGHSPSGRKGGDRNKIV